MAVVDSGRRTSSGATIWKAAPSRPSSSGGSGGGSGGGGKPKKGTWLVPGGKTAGGKTVWVPAPAGTKFYQKTASGGVRYGGKTYSSVASA